LAGYRFDDLGWLQFQQLVTELFADMGLPANTWLGDADRLRTAPLTTEAADALGVAPGGDVAVVWFSADQVPTIFEWLPELRPPILVLSNRELPMLGRSALPVERLAAELDARPHVRRRVPFMLGVRPLEELAEPAVLERSTLDVPGAVELARVFVPTRAYRRALEVLAAHGFAVLTGPPEMGKTAAARTIALAALAEGWEAHECTSPDQLWSAYSPDCRQVFVADDAFGSTEYRPDAAVRWALELDRILPALDATHHLLWTSRPGPLRAALERIHREHGVERWPRPAEVHVDASALDPAEKALILFRHAQTAQLDADAVGVVRAHAEDIVGNEHFTPERIRRFVSRPISPEAIEGELREPTEAMAASLDALPDDLRTVLVALLDTPPGPVAARDLALAVRRHEGTVARPPGEAVELLADHFLRVVPGERITWVHPSWRDLVIDRLAADRPARRRFLERCGLDGLLLSLSTGGGSSGERTLPLLLDDRDWDELGARIHVLAPELDDHDAMRLLLALGEALRQSRGADRAEAEAIAREVLGRLSWDGPIPAAVLAEWVALAGLVEPRPELPDLTATWIESLPTPAATIHDRDDLRRLDEWLSLVEILQEYDAAALMRFGFPAAQEAALERVARTALTFAGDDESHRELARRTLVKMLRYCPEAHRALQMVEHSEPTSEVDWWEPAALAAPATAPEAGAEPIVARIMRDLRNSDA
jgi:conflict system STAND superfamily ATPase